MAQKAPDLPLLEPWLGKAPQGGAWSSKARAEAQRRLCAMGLPQRRDEYWKYTRPDALTAAEPEPLAPAPAPSAFDGVEAFHIVFTDGVLDLAASDDFAQAPCVIEPLSAAAQADLHWASQLYGKLEAAGQAPVARPLAALNTALAQEGLLIKVTGADVRVHLTYRYTSAACDAMLRHVIDLAPRASLTLIEEGQMGARANKVIESFIAQGAEFDHICIAGRETGRTQATHLFARLDHESQLRSFTLGMDAARVRNEAVLTFHGDDATASIGGAYLGDGRATHMDDTVFVTHDAVNCESRQVFKKVLRNGATGVFQGKILVKPDAQKTDGYQISQGLLLDEDSQFLAKPELEIYADDVACSHGSTCGALDATALFYLTSRGIPRDQAQDLLTLSFLGEALDEIADEALRALVLARLESWMGARR